MGCQHLLSPCYTALLDAGARYCLVTNIGRTYESAWLELTLLKLSVEGAFKSPFIVLSVPTNVLSDSAT
jgi:hypothetical protein